ncbi:hypothetical protein, partial [Salmonella sp. s54395]|uniref:hypothetical protein n=1 Tax=Salmonella sp. s54395 TaxID=3159664 RepID=UPI00397EE705
MDVWREELVEYGHVWIEEPVEYEHVGIEEPVVWLDRIPGSWHGATRYLQGRKPTSLISSLSCCYIEGDTTNTTLFET